MSKYLITGRQGSGKTTVIKQLQKLGYLAYNTDDLPKVTKLQNRETGEVIEWPDTKIDWSKFAWNWQEDSLKELLNTGDPVFIGAVTSNQTDYYDLFDAVYVLVVGAEILRSRLEKHQHPSHHIPGEIDRILSNHERNQQHFIDEGAIPVNASGTPKEIVKDILKRIGT